ncbi:MAG TPA: histidinol-phosphate transaminase [Acidobacteriaceae bacterium]|nr:histidinol-phosphate transaminase [Acidobacteriaceae bacterium]
MSAMTELEKPVIASSAAVQPRRMVVSMPEYHPPLAGRNALRLDFNENTFAASPKVIARLRETTAEDLTKYPEREGVEAVTAAHFGLDARQVLLTNGVDEAIHIVCAGLLEEDDEAIICTPTFFMYEVSVRMMTPHLVRVQADASLAFPYERFVTAITPRSKLVVISSPNNPTGSVVSREQILAICAKAPHAAVLVDEAYYHFHGETVLDDVRRVPNLLVARTFSKAYGMASLRIGMLAGNAELIRYMRKVSSPYNVNGVALDCLPVALADDAYIAWYADQVHVGLARTMEALRRLGVEFFPSHANFVLMKIGPKHAELVKAMRARGVLLRDRSSDPGCDGFVRITVGVEEHVTRGLKALEESLAEIGWKLGQDRTATSQSGNEDEREWE